MKSSKNTIRQPPGKPLASSSILPLHVLEVNGCGNSNGISLTQISSNKDLLYSSSKFDSEFKKVGSQGKNNFA